jgi:hypothetical protein
MAKYRIEGAPKGKAYVNILDDGPRLVNNGDTVIVADETIPGDWMKPIDAVARTAVARREKLQGEAKKNRLIELEAEIAKLKADDQKAA